MTKVKCIIKYIIVFLILLGVCIFINKALLIKGLYKDDLYNWSWFPGMKFFDFSFGFYSETRYRPFFNALQYLEYMFVGNSPIRFTYFNYFTNTLLALFVYHFAMRLKAKNFVAMIVSILYLVAHFAYYQIGQAFGLLETEAQFFALLILLLCFKLVGIIEMKSYIAVVIAIVVVFFIEAFTHERYLCLAPIIIVSLLYARDSKLDKMSIKQKLLSIIFFTFTIIIIAFIRYKAIGKVVPAGTGGTYVEETFDFMTTFKNCFTQLAFIFGINIGPEHLVGIEFKTLQNTLIKYFGIASICAIMLIFVIYLLIKINTKEKKTLWDSFLPDILFVLFIVMCIGASSVTIRIEMRFIYASFTCCLLYLAFVCGYIFKKENVFFTMIFVILTAGFFILRVPLEMKYRNNFDKVHCIVDQMMINSLYDNTIGVYGVDDVLKNKNVYIIKNFFGMTDFYRETIYKIYDKENKGTVIKIIDEENNKDVDVNDEKNLVFIEDIANNQYIRYKG